MTSRNILVRSGERLDFTFDWGDWLGVGDSIAGYLWSAEPDGDLTLTNPTGAVVTVDGFVAGEVYRLISTVTTAQGIVGSRQLVLRCQ